MTSSVIPSLNLNLNADWIQSWCLFNIRISAIFERDNPKFHAIMSTYVPSLVFCRIYKRVDGDWGVFINDKCNAPLVFVEFVVSLDNIDQETEIIAKWFYRWVWSKNSTWCDTNSSLGIEASSLTHQNNIKVNGQGNLKICPLIVSFFNYIFVFDCIENHFHEIK